VFAALGIDNSILTSQRTRLVSIIVATS